jgi:hypothetical protein
MSDQLKNTSIELSDEDLETVAGGHGRSHCGGGPRQIGIINKGTIILESGATLIGIENNSGHH